MSNKITSARITPMPKSLFDDMPKVIVKVGNEEKEHELFSYYPDEISFTPQEFIGLTIEQAKALRTKKDIDYLQS